MTGETGGGGVVWSARLLSAMLVDTLKNCKPDDRSDLDRRYAILITDAEKLQALVRAWLGEAEKS